MNAIPSADPGPDLHGAPEQCAPEPPERAFASTPGNLRARTPRGKWRDVKIRRLSEHPVVAGCSSWQLRRIAGVADEVDVSAGVLLASQGWLGYWFFLIFEGSAEVVRDGQPIGVLGPGACFGEEAALGAVFSGESVRSLTEMTVVVIHNQHFAPLVDDIATLRRAFAPARDRGRAVRVAREARTCRVPTSGVPRMRAVPIPRPRAFQRPSPLRPTIVVNPPVAVPVRRGRSWAVAAGALLALTGFGLRYHPPEILATPGHAVDISHDITITGVVSHEPVGRYLLTPVHFSRPNLLQFIAAELRNRDVFAVRGPRLDTRERAREQAAAKATFERSRTDAAAAVAKLTGRSFTATFRRRDISGPSAGLVYALAISDMVSGPQLSPGLAVAATGTIDTSGHVGDVGYLYDKAIAARRGGGAFFIVPRGQVPDIGRLAIREATTLQQVLHDLRVWSKGGAGSS